MESTNKEILRRLIFEIVERVARFSSHLGEIKAQFYNDEDTIVKDKIAFIDSYEGCILKYFQIASSYLALIENSDSPYATNDVFEKLTVVLKSINDLHLNHLVHLPRPNEPVELRRFGRVIKKQVFNIEEDISNSKSAISIYINEQIGEVSYASDPLQKFKEDNINTLIFDFTNSFGYSFNLKEFDGHKNSDAIHVTISRIDATNVCHWPTLLHEVSHHLMSQKKWFEEKDILADFLKFIERQNVSNLSSLISPKVNLASWLTECWCDLFACASIGPSFYFAQFNAFLNYLEYDTNEKYPPFIFRLKLIEKILSRRFQSLKHIALEKEFGLTQKIMDSLEGNQRLKYNEEPGVRKLFSLFREYFLEHLFKSDENAELVLWDAELNSKFRKTMRYVNDISIERVEELGRSLANGWPIPSYVDKNEPIYCEKPTNVQEILYAAWNYKTEIFGDRILALIMENIRLHNSNEAELGKLFKESICKEFTRFDQSLLRSIQVSEYFDALYEPVDPDYKEPTKGQKDKDDGSERLLVDWEIKEYISKGNIRIIPLINLKHQLGSTSLDIRLGNTFELYLPNQFGILDFAEKESIKKISMSAQRINLDFMDSIAINPGQFVLGHSMEYIRLDDNISADLEGRSSFARLGIEIHMTAGFIDPGFEGVLTFEIYNAGPSPVKLYPSMRVGQLRFTKTYVPFKSYNKKHTAKYAGLLEYHSSKQNKDYEVARIIELKEKENRIR